MHINFFEIIIQSHILLDFFLLYFCFFWKGLRLAFLSLLFHFNMLITLLQFFFAKPNVGNLVSAIRNYEQELL